MDDTAARRLIRHRLIKQYSTSAPPPGDMVEFILGIVKEIIDSVKSEEPLPETGNPFAGIPPEDCDGEPGPHWREGK